MARMGRQFTVVQFEVNPRTGEKLQDLGEIAKRLRLYRSLTRWGWCIHDKDVYTQDAYDDMISVLMAEAKKAGISDESLLNDYVDKNRWFALGDVKQKHIHIVVQCKAAITTEQLARWLDVPEYLVKAIPGKGAFLDCIEYLTHERESQQELGKHRYDDSEVHTSDGFDFRAELDSRKSNEEKYGVGKTLEQKVIIDVAKYGKTLRECYAELDSDMYVKMLNHLQKARAEYLDKRAQLPNTRLNFYVDGRGGIGKDTLCELLARALCPDIKDLKDIAFNVGEAGSAFDRYDGQPVIIWGEMRGNAFNAVFKGGRRTILEAFDMHPKETAGRVDIKFGSTRLINSFNIINGIQPFNEFLNELAGSYTDKDGNKVRAEHSQDEMKQFYRRMPVIIPLREEDFDVLINRGVFEGTREYEQYFSYASMVGSFGRMRDLCGANTQLLIDVSKPAVEPIVDVSRVLTEKANSMTMTEEEIRKQLANVGTIKDGMLSMPGDSLEDKATAFKEQELRDEYYRHVGLEDRLEWEYARYYNNAKLKAHCGYHVKSYEEWLSGERVTTWGSTVMYREPEELLDRLWNEWNLLVDEPLPPSKNLENLARYGLYVKGVEPNFQNSEDNYAYKAKRGDFDDNDQ